MTLNIRLFLKSNCEYVKCLYNNNATINYQPNDIRNYTKKLNGRQGSIVGLCSASNNIHLFSSLLHDFNLFCCVS